MLNKILVPLDGSSLGELSFIYVKELANVFDSEVHLLSVVERKNVEYRRMIEVYMQKITEETGAYFNQVNPKVTVKSVLIEGSPHEETVNYAMQKRINLVIVVSHGRSGIMPWSMGSTANKMVHAIENPVLLVRASMFKAKRRPVKVFNKILLPLDGSEAGEAPLPFVREIAQKLNSEVTLFSVIEPGQHVRTIGGQDYIRFYESQIATMKAEMEDYLAAIRQTLAESGVSVRTVVKEGDAAREIIRYAKERNIRLVALSTHGKSGMREWVFGSVSNKVLQAGKTPLLLVRAKVITEVT